MTIGTIRALSLLPLLFLAAASAKERPGEFRLPEFDHDGVEATCVVALPPDYDAERTWPLILDFHGAIAPSRHGADLTRDRLWSRFVTEVPCIVAGLNGRTRAWGTIRGEHDDLAYARAALALLFERYSIDRSRVYLAGFSSGSDFLCSGGLPLEDGIAGCLVVCPGPPSVVGLRGGELLAAVKRPFVFATGEEDHVRKSGAWEAFLALDAAGGKVRYREVPERAHEFFDVEEYARLFAELERLAGRDDDTNPLERARAALTRGDLLAASEHKKLRAEVEAAGRDLAAVAEKVDGAKEPGREYEAWWRIRTQLHRFPKLAERAAAEMARIEAAIPGRDLHRARGNWFRRRETRAPPESGRADDPLWRFDRYLGPEEIGRALADLASRFPERATLESLGASVEGRDLPLLTVTDTRSGPPESKPAVWLMGGIHGNEAGSAMTVLYAAWQLAANPEGSRGTDRLLEDVTVYVAPVVNPDALHDYLTGAFSHWRPRFNSRPHDADGDGRIDEDPAEDLDGDGEIGLMYAPDPEGPFVLRDGRMVRGEGDRRYRLVGREGTDDDGDGKFSEDPKGGVNLNRNFPVGFRPRRDYEGFRGPEPLSEPESAAVARFVTEHPNIAFFLDYHLNGNCVFYWLGPEPGGDEALLDAIAGRARDALGYEPKPLRHDGVGLAAAWAAGARGIPALIVELESSRGPRADYERTRWNDDVFVPARPFDHPQLGPVLIGNDGRKIAARNLHPADIFWQADRNFAWLKAELALLPKLELADPVILPTEDGFAVSGSVVNAGSMPLDPARARAAGVGRPISITAEGAEVEGAAALATSAPGASLPFRVQLRPTDSTVTLRIAHPRGGVLELPVVRPRRETIPIRREYEIEPGFATVETARRTDNGFFADGVAAEERGPAFEVTHRAPTMRIAVLLAEWEDFRHTIDEEEFDRAFFSKDAYRERTATGQPAYGSVRDFYAEMSHGRFEVTGRVLPWVTIPGTHAEARDASFGSPELTNRTIEAVLARDGPDALADFDALVFVWAGNAVRRTSMLWPMRVTMRDRPGVVAFKTSELFRGEMMPIGVACHELAHVFGVNDKYGLGASANPLGPWCLIGKGTHGAEPGGRHRPFHLCTWCKSVLGWLDPAVIDPATPQQLALRPVTYGPGEAYRVLLTPDGGESLLLTNRRREGFFTDLPSAGLVVLRVGPNDNPGAPQKRVELLPAHGLPPVERSDPARPEGVAWPFGGKTELVVGNVRLSDIRIAGDVVYLTVGPAD